MARTLLHGRKALRPSALASCHNPIAWRKPAKSTGAKKCSDVGSAAPLIPATIHTGYESAPRKAVRATRQPANCSKGHDIHVYHVNFYQPLGSHLSPIFVGPGLRKLPRSHYSFVSRTVFPCRNFLSAPRKCLLYECRHWALFPLASASFNSPRTPLPFR